MKFTAAAIITTLAGPALAAPKQFTQPGGDHDYQPIYRRDAASKQFIQPGGDHDYQPIYRRDAASKQFIQPGGDHDYQPIYRRDVAGTGSLLARSNELNKRVIGPVALAAYTVMASVIGGFIAGPVAIRIMNEKFGVQKRDTHYDLNDLTFNESRKIFLEAFVEAYYKEYPYDRNDAAVCTSVGYYISDPAATLESSAWRYTALGHKAEFDCLIITGPVQFEVRPNATDLEFFWKGPANAVFANGTLTIPA